MVHYQRNYKKLFLTPKLNLLLSRAANAYSSVNYKISIESLQNQSPAAYTWAMEEPVEYWCRHTFETTTKVPDNSTNFVESFNNVLDNCRDLPIFNVCEVIREKVCEWFVKRKAEAEGWTGRIVPSVKEKLAKFESEGWKFMLRCCEESIFEVHDGWTQFVVDLKAKTCDCNYWQLSGIPCKHAVKCLSYMKVDLEEWVDGWYTIDKYKATYSGNIYPVRDSCFWPSLETIPLLAPPPVERKRGPLKKDRRRGADEGAKKRTRGRSTTVRCSKCKQLGHNKAGCRQYGHEPYKRKKKPPTGNPVGRPKKVQLPSSTICKLETIYFAYML